MKNSKLRLLTQAISFTFSNGYIYGWIKGKIYTGPVKNICLPGLNCYSCPGAIASCPIGSLQAVLGSGEYRVSLYVLGFIGAVGMLCGRFVCGWLCPFGFIQDLLYKIPFVKKVKNLPGHRFLKYLRFAVLLLLVILLPFFALNDAGVGTPWFCKYICPSGTLIGGIPLALANESVRDALGLPFILKSGILALIIIGSIYSYRPFCKYLCPLGALYGLANPVSLYRYHIDESACTKCGACQKVCPVDIKTWETPNSMDCIRCGKCKEICPHHAIK